MKEDDEEKKKTQLFLLDIGILEYLVMLLLFKKMFLLPFNISLMIF